MLTAKAARVDAQGLSGPSSKQAAIDLLALTFRDVARARPSELLSTVSLACDLVSGALLLACRCIEEIN